MRSVLQSAAPAVPAGPGGVPRGRRRAAARDRAQPVRGPEPRHHPAEPHGAEPRRRALPLVSTARARARPGRPADRPCAPQRAAAQPHAALPVAHAARAARRRHAAARGAPGAPGAARRRQQVRSARAGPRGASLTGPLQVGGPRGRARAPLRAAHGAPRARRPPRPRRPRRPPARRRPHRGAAREQEVLRRRRSVSAPRSLIYAFVTRPPSDYSSRRTSLARRVSRLPASQT